MSRRLILCADDFAQSPPISAGILALIDAGRLSATSVFSLSAHWPALAPALRDAPADIGLHLNLTEPFDPAARPLSHWLLASRLSRLPLETLRQGFLRQIDAFAEALGRLPDYLDGHQHVHALPQVRTAVIEAIERRWPAGTRPYLRRPDRLADGGDSAFKGAIVRLASAGFSRRLAAHGLTGPDWFAGLYSFDPKADYRALMRRWLAAMPATGLVMCHPGHPDSVPDPIAATRPQEWHYFAGDAFAADLAQAGVRIGRWQD